MANMPVIDTDRISKAQYNVIFHGLIFVLEVSSCYFHTDAKVKVGTFYPVMVSQS